MCSDYMRYVSKKNSSAIDTIGKELKGEGRNKKEYYHALLKEGYYFSCTSENLPMNERNEIYVSNFVEFKKMLRSITLLESAAKAEKKLRDAAKRREKRLQKMIEGKLRSRSTIRSVRSTYWACQDCWKVMPLEPESSQLK